MTKLISCFCKPKDNKIEIFAQYFDKAINKLFFLKAMRILVY